MRGDFVTAVRSKLCKKWESPIKSMNGNNDTGVREESKCVKKNTLESASYKKAADCERRKSIGIHKYTEKIIDETHIGKGLKRMGTDDKKALVIKFSTAYYLAKNERLFSDYPELLELLEKSGVRDIGKAYLTGKKCAEFTKNIAHVIRTELDNDLQNCNYIMRLNDESTGSSITEQEVIYVLYLKDGVLTVRYLSIETLNVANAPGKVTSIEDAFKRVSCRDFMDKLVGINVDGVSVNLGRHKGVGTLLKENSP